MKITGYPGAGSWAGTRVTGSDPGTWVHIPSIAIMGLKSPWKVALKNLAFRFLKQDAVLSQGRTTRCRCKFWYVSNFTTASRGFSTTARISSWSNLSADCSELPVKKWQVLDRTNQIAYLTQTSNQLIMYHSQLLPSSLFTANVA